MVLGHISYDITCKIGGIIETVYSIINYRGFKHLCKLILNHWVGNSFKAWAFIGIHSIELTSLQTMTVFYCFIGPIKDASPNNAL